MKSKVESLLWVQLDKLIEMNSALFLSLDEADETTVDVESAHNLDPAPFRGSEKYAVVDIIKEIFTTQRKSHIHSIKKYALSNLIPKHGGSPHVAAIANFASHKHHDKTYVFLIFPKDNRRSDTFTETLDRAIPVFSEFFWEKRMLAEMRERLTVTEIFVREIGHDLTTAVQAVVSKLRIICDGAIDVEMMRNKASDALVEVMNAYSVADSLGLAVDSSYVARSEIWFQLSKLVSEASDFLEAEAKEKNISIKQSIEETIEIKGDAPAIQLVFKHIILNAIKYSLDSRNVHINARKEEDRIVVDIINNTKVPLPRTAAERSKVFEFGYRSQLAREEHVTGSGVGLFTAKKIILAHDGLIWCEGAERETKFHITFPKIRVRGVTFKRYK